MNKKIKNVMVIGDVHAGFNKLNTLINKKKPDIIYVCGDFGYWPGEYPVSEIKPQQTKIYFCDGNHENHDALKKIRDLYPHAITLRTPIEITKNVYYCPRGTITYTPDGRRVLWIGGAYSIDKRYRTPGYDWFPEETIKQHEIENIIPDGKVDILISHTCSQYQLKEMLLVNSLKDFDPTNHALSCVIYDTRPDLHYFGHWHYYKEGYIPQTDTHWTALNMASHDGWWKWLKQ